MTTATAEMSVRNRVLDVFRDLDPVTATQIVNATGLRRDEVTEALRALAATGDVVRVDVWLLPPDRSNHNGSEHTRKGRTATGRRLAGVLEEEILRFMRDRADEEVGPHEAARAIGARAGAVRPALERMRVRGLVVKSTERPVRYKLAAPPRTRTTTRKH